MNETQFLKALYNALTKNGHQTMIEHLNLESVHPGWNTPSNPHRSPRNMGWRWVFSGTQDRWWIEITDERPPMNGRPYRIDPVGDPLFFSWAQSQGLDRLEKIQVIVTTLVTYMDENLIGQTKAQKAYQNGATIRNPPWVHTCN